MSKEVFYVTLHCSFGTLSKSSMSPYIAVLELNVIEYSMSRCIADFEFHVTE